METFIDRWINQGVAQGVAQGLQQGLEEGLERGLRQGVRQGVQQGQHSHAVRVAVRLAAKRLGTLPPETEARLAGLSTAQLDELCLAVLDFASVADLTDWISVNTPQDNEFIN